MDFADVMLAGFKVVILAFVMAALSILGVFLLSQLASTFEVSIGDLGIAVVCLVVGAFIAWVWMDMPGNEVERS
jgi:hypothetical protein